MKTILAIIALALATPIAWGQSTTTTTEKEKTTTTTTTGSGTITEYVPGKTIILKEEGGPKTYTFSKKVVYVTKSGKTLPDEEVKTRIKVGAPISVHYIKEGDSMSVSKVVIDD